MSAICGIVGLSGQCVEAAELRPVADALRRSGPDGYHEWLSDSAAFAHWMLFTTPESLSEKLPFRDPESRLTITADARIDNRSEIFSALGISPPAQARISDSELILLSFKAWEQGCLDRLIGDFAFAIWNEESRELFLAKDHLGVRALYHTEVGGRFLFASEIKSLLAHPLIARVLNPDRLRSSIENTDPDREATFYRGIHRLPPATWMRIKADGTKSCGVYWKLEPQKELPAQSDEEYARQFRVLFEEAVRCRLRSAFPVGSHLSGGLDSTAVTCMAKSILSDRQDAPAFKTFSMVFGSLRKCDEREYIDPVVNELKLDAYYVEADRVGPLYHIDEYFDFEEEGSLPPNNFLVEQLYERAQAVGIRVCLDGFDGDTTVGHGYERFTELARQRRWTEFEEEATAVFNRDSRISKERLFWLYGAPELGARARRGQWRSFVSDFHSAKRKFDVSLRQLICDHVLKPALPATTRGYIRSLRAAWHERRSGQRSRKPDFFNHSVSRPSKSFQGSVAAGKNKNNAPTVREEQCHTFSSGLFSFALEHMSRLHARYGIEVRHPFLDKRLVEFCVALPSSQKLRSGFNRAIMRAALVGVLPEAIRCRTTKANYSQAQISGALLRDRDVIRQKLAEFGTMEKCPVNAQLMQERFEFMITASRIRDDEFRAFLAAFTTAYWLQRTRFATQHLTNESYN